MSNRIDDLLPRGAFCVARGGHGVGDLVEAVIEEVAVGVQGHRGRPVAEHLLNDLDVGA